MLLTIRCSLGRYLVSVYSHHDRALSHAPVWSGEEFNIVSG